MKMPTYLDFSAAGTKAAAIEFFQSLAKTALAAVIAYVLLKLKDLHVANFVNPEYATLALAAVGTIRALLTSAWTWLTTSYPAGVSSVPDPTTLGDGSVMQA